VWLYTGGVSLILLDVQFGTLSLDWITNLIWILHQHETCMTFTTAGLIADKWIKVENVYFSIKPNMLDIKLCS